MKVIVQYSNQVCKLVYQRFELRPARAVYLESVFGSLGTLSTIE